MHRLIGYMHSLPIYALMPEVGKYSFQPHENYNMDEKPGQHFLSNLHKKFKKVLQFRKIDGKIRAYFIQIF